MVIVVWRKQVFEIESNPNLMLKRYGITSGKWKSEECTTPQFLTCLLNREKKKVYKFIDEIFAIFVSNLKIKFRSSGRDMT